MRQNLFYALGFAVGLIGTLAGNPIGVCVVGVVLVLVLKRR